MPNTMKCRRVCMVPEHRVFAVEGNARGQVVLTVDELDFSATEAEHLRAALREAAEEYATGEVKVLCEDGW